MSDHPRLQALVAQLETDDSQAQKRVGKMLLATGATAVPSLLQALGSAPAATRKAAAFLLGCYPASASVVMALGRSVDGDPEPKVRKNAGIALAKTGLAAAVAALASGLAKERVVWVRSSLILALGAIADDTASAVLKQLRATTSMEKEALNKALDRCLAQRRTSDAAWRLDGARKLRFQVNVPIGLERAALLEAWDHRLGSHRQVGPGSLRCPPGTNPLQLLPGLRCIKGLLIEAATGPPMELSDPRGSALTIGAMVAGSLPLQNIGHWLDPGPGKIKYRLVVTPKGMMPATFRALLSSVRQSCARFNLFDSPSGYDIQLVLRTNAMSSELFIRPSFVQDERFAYRKKDVGAAINPVVAACLARLARCPGSRTVFDPTCGSGTLLIERATLDNKTQLRGLDVSRTAVAAARYNVRGVGLTSRVSFHVGNAVETTCWRSCDEVLANLPFGLRSRRRDKNLPHLYEAVVRNISLYLKPGGRALLYTANRKLLEHSLVEHRRQLSVQQTLMVKSGGVRIGAWILTRRIRAPHGPRITNSP